MNPEESKDPRRSHSFIYDYFLGPENEDKSHPKPKREYRSDSIEYETSAILKWNRISLNDFTIISKSITKLGLKLFLAENNYTGNLYQIRQLKWDRVEKELVKNELMIIDKIKPCDRVIRNCFHFENEGKFYFAAQYMSGGNLRTLLDSMRNLKEEIIKLYVAQIIIILRNIHKCSVIFCNLRPESIYFDENVLFNSNYRDSSD